MATVSYLNPDFTFNRAGIMKAAWASARAMIVPPRPMRGYTPPPRPSLREAFKQALRRIWDLAKGHRACELARAVEVAKAAAIAALPEAERAVAETARITETLRHDFLCASMIDSLPAMIAEQAAVRARAASYGVSL